MKGIILINAYPPAPKFFEQAERIKSELISLGADVRVVKNGEICACVSSDGKMHMTGLDGDERFCVYLDKDKYLSRALEGVGIRLFNTSRAVEVCDDKALTYLALEKSGAAVAETVFAPLCYTKDVEPSADFLKTVETSLSFPLVAKKSYGSFGAGVRLVKTREELLSVEKEWMFEPHFYQKYLTTSRGSDVRVIVVGGKAIGAMKRTAQTGEFRSNVELGGIAEKTELTCAFAQAAERAAVTLGLDYCGVDLLYGEDGEPVLCEVNSNAFFHAFERVTGVNVAKAYAEHIIASV